jgi:hypothetical protein
VHWTASQITLVVVLLAACITCIWMVFFFGRRLQSTAFLRDSLVEGVRQQELKPLLRELTDKAMEGPLDPAHPPPDAFGPTAQLWAPKGIWVEYSDRLSDRRVSGTESDEARQERHQALADCQAWAVAEHARYEALRRAADAEALKKAEKRVPRSMDISLLGGGWAFLLEFSTVIVIIFSVLVLAILRTLSGQEIATILAAIAGYVLGKASAGQRSHGGRDPADVTPLRRPASSADLIAPDEV